MKQPELGLKVTELRQHKGITQEKLAELCEISTRTVQRIENGEVDPRMFTLTSLGEALDFDFAAGDLENENLWLTALHLTNVFPNVLFPMIIWSWKKTQSFTLDQHGKEVVNFQITMLLALFANVLVLVFIPTLLIFFPEWNANQQTNDLIGILTLCATFPMILIGIFCFVQAVINTLRVLTDKPIHYPLSIRFVR